MCGPYRVSTIAVAKNLSMHEILNFAGSDSGTKSQHNNIVCFFIKRNLKILTTHVHLIQTTTDAAYLIQQCCILTHWYYKTCYAWRDKSFHCTDCICIPNFEQKLREPSEYRQSNGAEQGRINVLFGSLCFFT